MGINLFPLNPFPLSYRVQLPDFLPLKDSLYAFLNGFLTVMPCIACPSATSSERIVLAPPAIANTCNLPLG